MVMPRSCSSFLVSVNRLPKCYSPSGLDFMCHTYASPAFAAEIIPARWTRESVKVDFPWSTVILVSFTLPCDKALETNREQ
jgi:hypothetical protein